MDIIWNSRQDLNRNKQEDNQKLIDSVNKLKVPLNGKPNKPQSGGLNKTIRNKANKGCIKNGTRGASPKVDGLKNHSEV